MKKTFTMMIAMIFLLSLSASSAFAGSKQRYRWQGVAMGVGAAILGNAILNNSRDDYHGDDSYRDRSYGEHRGYRNYSCPERVVVVDRAPCNSYCEPVHSSGHWEIRKVWVDPVCESVWNPGHYNKHNHWVSGRYITIETSPGYWREERVWVACR